MKIYQIATLCAMVTAFALNQTYGMDTTHPAGTTQEQTETVTVQTPEQAEVQTRVAEAQMREARAETVKAAKIALAKIALAEAAAEVQAAKLKLAQAEKAHLIAAAEVQAQVRAQARRRILRRN